jgi:hypothetical protein
MAAHGNRDRLPRAGLFVLCASRAILRAVVGKKSSRLRRFTVRALAGAGVVTVGLWAGIHYVPWLGPALADGVRAVVGPGPVAWLEDAVYGVEDRVNRVRFKDAKPKTFWDEPASATSAAAAPPEVATSAAPAKELEGFPPPAFAPPFDNVKAEGDGTWIPLADLDKKDAAPPMYKAVVHPDPKRSFAAVAVVAVDLRRLELSFVAGTTEPESMKVPKERRPGLVPSDKQADLVAAFNGGFKATHGHYGMMIAGDTFLVPRDIACTIALYRSGPIKIRTWPALAPSEADMTAYRQTPPCLVEQGVANAALGLEYNRNWGATVSGETVIRRSALGIDATGNILFYGLGEAVTAQALGRAMRVVGARDAAQLDVNYAYPRFLLYEHGTAGEPPHAATALIKDVKFEPADYVVEPSVRDFFYLTRRKTTS